MKLIRALLIAPLLSGCIVSSAKKVDVVRYGTACESLPAMKRVLFVPPTLTQLMIVPDRGPTTFVPVLWIPAKTDGDSTTSSVGPEGLGPRSGNATTWTEALDSLANWPVAAKSFDVPVPYDSDSSTGRRSGLTPEPVPAVEAEMAVYEVVRMKLAARGIDIVGQELAAEEKQAAKRAGTPEVAAVPFTDDFGMQAVLATRVSREAVTYTLTNRQGLMVESRCSYTQVTSVGLALERAAECAAEGVVVALQSQGRGGSCLDGAPR